MSKFSFPDDSFSKCQWIFTKLVVCIDIVKIWFGIADGQIPSIFDSYVSVFAFLDDNFGKYGFSLDLVYALHWYCDLLKDCQQQS